MLKYLSFHKSSFHLKILFKCEWQGPSVTHPLLFQVLGFKPLHAQVVDPTQKVRELP
jgi:hypothetical protein